LIKWKVKVETKADPRAIGTAIEKQRRIPGYKLLDDKTGLAAFEGASR
jgi:hypothetical protein